MRLSELQLKEIVNIRDGKRIGVIVDVIVDDKGNIDKLILEEKRNRRFSRDECEIRWCTASLIAKEVVEGSELAFVLTCLTHCIELA